MRRNASTIVLLFLAACGRGPGGGAPGSSAHAAESAAASAVAPTGSAVVAASAPAVSAAPTSAPAADAGKLQLDGKAIQGGIIRAKLLGKLRKMTFPGHRVIVSDDGEFLIGFSRDAPAKEKLTITFDDGTTVEHPFDVEQRTYETDRINGLSEDMVNLDMPTRVALEKAEKRIEAARKHYGKKPCYKDGFLWPAHAKLTSHYGQPRILNGTDGGIHWGVDIAAPLGTSVRAPACGTVIFAEPDVPLSGNLVIVDHGQGLSSAFLHLGRINVKVNDEVKQGQVLGTVGNTGRTNGPHLDWRMNLFETRVDPELLAPPMK